jgi:hypothetical protein
MYWSTLVAVPYLFGLILGCYQLFSLIKRPDIVASVDEDKPQRQTKLTRKIFLINMIPFFTIRAIGYLMYGFGAFDYIQNHNVLYLIIHLIGCVILYNTFFLVALHWCELIHYVHGYSVRLNEKRMTKHRLVYVIFSVLWVLFETALCIVFGIRRSEIIYVDWCIRAQLVFDCFLCFILFLWFIVFNIRMRNSVWDFTPINLLTNEVESNREALEIKQKEQKVFYVMVWIIFIFSVQTIISFIYFEVYMSLNRNITSPNILPDEYLMTGCLIKIITEFLAFFNYYIFSSKFDIDTISSTSNNEESLALSRVIDSETPIKYQSDTRF